jgi:uncharacterized membrane protein YuzA (DUF378 family)
MAFIPAEKRRDIMSFMNESNMDRVIRVVVGLALLALGWTGMVGGGLGLVFKILGFIPLLTGIVGFCPLYAIFKFKTLKS